MPISLQGEGWPVTKEEAAGLWEETRSRCGFPDEVVAVRSVSEEEMKGLNKRYRDKDYATNVLTFSYENGEHDMAICLEVAAQEARERPMDIRDYVALLIVHGFLHVAGMDHEKSLTEMEQTRTVERAILTAMGFANESL